MIWHDIHLLNLFCNTRKLLSDRRLRPSVDEKCSEFVEDFFCAKYFNRVLCFANKSSSFVICWGKLMVSAWETPAMLVAGKNHIQHSWKLPKQSFFSAAAGMKKPDGVHALRLMVTVTSIYPRTSEVWRNASDVIVLYKAFPSCQFNTTCRRFSKRSARFTWTKTINDGVYSN